MTIFFWHFNGNLRTYDLKNSLKLLYISFWFKIDFFYQLSTTKVEKQVTLFNSKSCFVRINITFIFKEKEKVLFLCFQVVILFGIT